MEKKETAIHKIGRKTLDTAIRHEIDGWPPYSIMGIYQPHRPETHPDSPQPQEKNNKVIPCIYRPGSLIILAT